jgi:RimJ/RimL family protein N-acetyltransferase
MLAEGLLLSGAHVRLEPLGYHHIPGLLAAVAEDPALYRLSPVPRNEAEAARYMDTALEWQRAGTAVPFAIIRAGDGIVIGSTRFWNLEKWSWPPDHPQHSRGVYDGCEIGYTWLARSAIRTAVNTEAKLLMLTHAFETWRVLRVCLHTDARNQRSRNAIERIGGKFEGILRAHRMAADYSVRDSARFSIVAEEWPAVKERLRIRLDQA